MKDEGEKVKRLCFDIELDDNYIAALETIKSLLMTEPEQTGITNDTPLEQIYHECANTGLAILSKQMMDEGIYSKHRDEVELGMQVDDIFKDQ